MAILVKKSGTEFLVNTQTSGLQFFQSVDTVAGGFIVAWLDQSHGMRAQRFDGTGAKVGGEVPVNNVPYQAGWVAGLSSGDFVASWTEGGEIKARIFNSAGAPAGGVIAVTTGGDHDQSRVLGLTAGGFVVTWWDLASGSNGFNVSAQVFDAAGAKVGTEILVNSATLGVQNTPAGTALSNGGFILTWTDQQAGGGDPDLSVKGQLFDAAGNKVGDNFLVNTVVASVQSTPDVAALPGGGFVVAWQSYDGTYRAKAQIFDALGNKVGPEVLASTPGHDVTGCSVTALPWGGFLVAWENIAPPGYNTTSVRAQLFDPAGSAMGAQFQINTAASDFNLHVDLTALASGQVLAVWTNERGNGAEQVGVKAQILTMPTVGTAGADVMTGGAGDDALAGLGGNDEIHGGGGADALLGGSGNDILDGGSGADELEGGFGDDILFVDDPGDLVVELAGGGNDRVNTSVSYALAAGSAIETLAAGDPAGAAAINLTGNELANALIGNAGPNRLDGGGGNDRLEGGAGDDRLIGGDGDDRLIGGDGKDMLEGGAGADTFAFLAVIESREYVLRSDGRKFAPDPIVDFTSGTDQIDLSAIDAIAGTAANDAFTFIGTGAFTGQAGQLRCDLIGDWMHIFADIDGNSSADLTIIARTPILQATDLIL